MNDLIFVFVSVLYVTILPVVDGMFNRLIFLDKRTLPYESEHKKNHYKHWEWKIIGLLLIGILPFGIPPVVAFAIGGVRDILIYFIVLCAIPWDIIFGKIVFNRWLGDTPSFALPFFGWFKFKLTHILIARFLISAVLFSIVRIYF
jgi:hypothetical protein